LKFGIKHKVF